MEDIDPASLGEIAYGTFEIFLTREFHARGRYLFDLVERGIDFTADLSEIFGEFQREYPALALALSQEFNGIDGIYTLIQEGEGVLPSKTTGVHWIILDAPGAEGSGLGDERAGKWLIFVPEDEVDAAWKKVRDETMKGTLGISAKVSTAKPNPDSRDWRAVIYVYTRDWADEADVMRVRERLRDLGFTERIGYKRNIETYRGEYSKEGRRVTYYSA